ncbi:MAG: flagellar brake protein [Magnetococcales bacterium]|nr:flagellar brake protein [Magnetococcales bacterium]
MNIKANSRSIISEEETILQLLEAVQSGRIFINLSLQGKEQNYRTRLLKIGDNKDSLFFAPLEPAQGNMKIRACRDTAAVNISFVYKNQIYQGSITFLKVLAVNGNNLLQCTLPEQLQPTQKIRRREESRVIVLNKTDLIVTVMMKGRQKVSGVIEDLSTGGLSFSCPSLSSPFKGGDVVSISIGGDLLKGKPIIASGIIRRCVIMRQDQKTDKCADYYGLQFYNLSPATDIAIDRLVRSRFTK